MAWGTCSLPSGGWQGWLKSAMSRRDLVDAVTADRVLERKRGSESDD